HPTPLSCRAACTAPIPSLSLHDALPIWPACQDDAPAVVFFHPPEGLFPLFPHVRFGPALLGPGGVNRLAGFMLGNLPEFFAQLGDRKSTRLNSSHVSTSYAVFCLKKKQVPGISEVTHCHGRLVACRLRVARERTSAHRGVCARDRGALLEWPHVPQRTTHRGPAVH